ncbi:conjugal transfer protein TrbI [Megamonas rupellensis]|jgi:type IV secretory pathway VirB10-like protein|uniref:Conjugal transfer protein TrbI n=1 Tax=Megamonas rupellensis TaxID=491921 RepID=A0A411ZKW6_9FIRM|nr:TrbI/VirB10 family protein [Megamonas rupellensis]RGQ03444.1 conjugal transfer protein TrbI [Megamonas rupellensis]
MSFKEKIENLFHRNKKKSDDELINEEFPENEVGEISFEDVSTEDEVKTLQKKKIMIVGGVIAVVAIAAVVSNAMTDKKQQQQDRPLSSASIAASPVQALPDKYSDIAKYNKDNEEEKKLRKDEIRGKSDTKTATNGVATNRQQVNSSSNSGTGTGTTKNGEKVVYVRPSNSVSSANSFDKEQRKAEAEAEAKREAMISSSLAFAIASDVANGKSIKEAVNDNINASTVSTEYDNYNDDNFVDYGISYTLNAGTVIPATLLTGITSDVPGGDVVAQIRQDVYDSLTGTHLLIPQGSRLIGTSGQAGSRGNKRIGVIFTRIILPSGVSIILPDQKAIDGVGYPGLEDEYTEHKGAAYGSAFMAALLGAAAQSATGDTSGDDERSPGQEAVAGAVAEILRTGEKFVDRELQKQPTITINPGFQFSVFINQDLNLGEYNDF